MGLQEEMREVRRVLAKIYALLERIYLLLVAEREREALIQRINRILPHVDKEEDAEKLMSLLSQLRSGRVLSEKQLKMLRAMEYEYGDKEVSSGAVSRPRRRRRRNTSNTR